MRRFKTLGALLGLSLIASMGTLARGGVGSIDALLSIGYYINFENTSPIKLRADSGAPDPFHTFGGCMESVVSSNFNARLYASIRPTSPAGGNWEVDLSPFIIPPGQIQVRLCVVGTNVQIEKLPGGQANLKVAEIKIEVTGQ